MSESVIFQETVEPIQRETLLSRFSEAAEDVASLGSELQLLSSPDVMQHPDHGMLIRCYEAGERHANQSVQETAKVLPESIVRTDSMWIQGVGVLCAAAGRLIPQNLPLTHNQLCDQVAKLTAALPQPHEEFCSGFYTIRSVALPVFRRLMRDGHPRQVILLQTLLHLLAWKSDSLYARQQAQRLLWQGGILGEAGYQKLMGLDDALTERQPGKTELPVMLAFTDFLARFPAGPFFID